MIDKTNKNKLISAIGIIGATVPDEDYDPKEGIKIGEKLRKYIEEKSGVLFTGGVEGVGTDVYRGVVKATKELKSNQDKFFVLIPTHFYVRLNETEELKKVPYIVPKEYRDTAKEINKPLEIVYAGENMEERRTALANLTDIAIVLNGGYGTLDEAVKIISYSKPVISLGYTGGSAKLLELIKKEERLPILLKAKLDKMGFNLKDINKDLIYSIKKKENMESELENILSKLSF